MHGSKPKNILIVFKTLKRGSKLKNILILQHKRNKRSKYFTQGLNDSLYLKYIIIQNAVIINYDLILQISIGNIQSETMEERNRSVIGMYKSMKPGDNSSVSFQKIKNQSDSSISQKINNYTNELKGYLLEQLDRAAKTVPIQDERFQAKLKVQSSKNVPNSTNYKPKESKIFKSANKIKLKSQSSTHSCLQIANLMQNNQLTQKQNNNRCQKLTSLSKIVDKKQKSVFLQGNQSTRLKCTDLQSRLSKLQSLVQTLLKEKIVKSIHSKTHSLSRLKQGKTILRSRLLTNSEKKKTLSLPPRDNQVISKNKKISTKVQILKNSTEMGQESNSKRIIRNMKENQKQTYNLKKPNLKLDKDYHPITEYNMKGLKRVHFRSQKIEGAAQKSHNRK